MRSSEIFTDTSSALISEPLPAPCRTSPPARETIIAAATSLASPTVAWLIPFSKRAEDSLRKLNCFAVRRIEIGSNKADSSATVVVSFVISESNPPMTPAKATGSLPLVMTRLSVVNSRDSPSSVTNVSFSFARRTKISFDFNLS